MRDEPDMILARVLRVSLIRKIRADVINKTILYNILHHMEVIGNGNRTIKQCYDI